MSVIKNIINHKIYTSLRAFAVITLALVMVTHTTNAQTIADSPCDPEYFESLKSRAWLEAQREITQNQNLIFKPDSVLEYTCFGGHLAELSVHAADMFSENPRWGVNPGNMIGALTDLVYTAQVSYIEANFGHDPLGGRAEDLETPYGFPGTSYECDVMNRVWLEAKCMDFINNQDHDGFYTFEEYSTSDDHRFLPRACLAIQGRWENNLMVALDTDTTPWLEDAITPYLAELKHAACATAIPLETGVTVKGLENRPDFAEHVCVPPGCYYNGATCVDQFPNQ